MLKQAQNKTVSWGLEKMSFIDELNKEMVNNPARGKGRGKQLFLAQRSDISDALNAGYKMTEIWQYLHNNDKMPITYRVFAEYVYRHIKRVAKVTLEDTTKEKEEPIPNNNPIKNTTSDSTLKSQSEYTYNSKSTTDKVKKYA